MLGQQPWWQLTFTWQATKRLPLFKAAFSTSSSNGMCISSWHKGHLCSSAACKVLAFGVGLADSLLTKRSKFGSWSTMIFWSKLNRTSHSQCLKPAFQAICKAGSVHSNGRLSDRSGQWNPRWATNFWQSSSLNFGTKLRQSQERSDANEAESMVSTKRLSANTKKTIHLEPKKTGEESSKILKYLI